MFPENFSFFCNSFVREKVRKYFRFFAKLSIDLFLEKNDFFRNKKCKNFAKNVIISRKKNNYGREIIDYDLIKLLMLSSQSSEFHKFFCCSYGFPQIFFRENIIREKVCEMRAKTFPFFSRTISFAGNPIYVAFCNVVCLVFCRVVCVVRVFKRTILLFLKTTVFKKLSVSFF